MFTPFYLSNDLFLNESGGGWLIDRMKKKRSAIRKQREKEDADQIQEREIVTENVEVNVQTDFEILKTTVVTDESMEFIKRKLIITQQYRQQMLSNLNSHLIECFPYFFIRPELVSVFFVQNM